MKVRLKLYGVFRSAVESSNVLIELPGETATVRAAIQMLAVHPEYRELVKLLLTDQNDPRPNALIMVSGREISCRNGLETPLLESDELSLLPVVHGG